MNFKCWVENEASLGAAAPEMAPPMVNKGTNTPASDEVKRTNLQPQVDAQEIETKSKKENDRILALDQDLERMDMNLPQGEDSDTPKLNKFKELWMQLKDQWDQIKMSDEEQPLEGEGGLGDQDDQRYRDTMQQHPNMVPAQPEGHGGGGFA